MPKSIASSRYLGTYLFLNLVIGHHYLIFLDNRTKHSMLEHLTKNQISIIIRFEMKSTVCALTTCMMHMTFHCVQTKKSFSVQSIFADL